MMEGRVPKRGREGKKMEWLDFGKDVTAMSIVAAIAAVGILVYFLSRKYIE